MALFSEIGLERNPEQMRSELRDSSIDPNELVRHDLSFDPRSTALRLYLHSDPRGLRWLMSEVPDEGVSWTLRLLSDSAAEKRVTDWDKAKARSLRVLRLRERHHVQAVKRGRNTESCSVNFLAVDGSHGTVAGKGKQ
jgi:hypothetical protein